MPKFTVSASVTVSAYTEVEANTLEEALEIAEEREVASLCANPFSASTEVAWHIDTDGAPSDITVDEL